MTPIEPRRVVEDWAERSCEANDRCLQELFRTVRGHVPHVRVRLGPASPGLLSAWSGSLVLSQHPKPAP
jgi:hypothetical protein